MGKKKFFTIGGGGRCSQPSHQAQRSHSKPSLDAWGTGASRHGPLRPSQV